MSKHLDKKELLSKYTLQEFKGKNPVSELDFAILEELGNVLEFIGNTDLLNIIRDYKNNVPDTDVLQRLRVLAGDFMLGEQEEKAKGEERVIPWINIKGEMFNLKDLFSITKGMYYKVDRYIYTIILNENVKDMVEFTNKTFEFRSEEQRDNYLEDLRERLETLGVKFF